MKKVSKATLEQITAAGGSVTRPNKKPEPAPVQKPPVKPKTDPALLKIGDAMKDQADSVKEIQKLIAGLLTGQGQAKQLTLEVIERDNDGDIKVLSLKTIQTKH